MNKQLIEKVDYYIDNGRVVFTKQYLIQRQFCCGNGCRHCPYNYVNVPEPKKTLLQQQNFLNEKTAQ